jgi:hypothetical protein
MTFLNLWKYLQISACVRYLIIMIIHLFLLKREYTYTCYTIYTYSVLSFNVIDEYGTSNPDYKYVYEALKYIITYCIVYAVTDS